MANYELATARITYQSAALATLGVDSIWDAAITRYLAAQALADADCEYGTLAAANEADEREEMRITEKYGRGWRSIPHALDEYRSLVAPRAGADDRWTRDFCDPLWAAQRELALCPAPTFAAAMFKAAFLADSEVWNDTKFPHDPMALLQADFARFTTAAPVTETAGPAPDQQIMEAWNRRRATMLIYDALPPGQGEGYDPMDGLDDNERACETIIDAAETIIERETATTPQGIARQLWTALARTFTSREEAAAANACDLDKLVAGSEVMDWNVRLILAALRGLKAMEA